MQSMKVKQTETGVTASYTPRFTIAACILALAALSALLAAKWKTLETFDRCIILCAFSFLAAMLMAILRKDVLEIDTVNGMLRTRHIRLWSRRANQWPLSDVADICLEKLPHKYKRYLFRPVVILRDGTSLPLTIAFGNHSDFADATETLQSAFHAALRARNDQRT